MNLLTEFERPYSKYKVRRAEEQTEEAIILAGGIFTTVARGPGRGAERGRDSFVDFRGVFRTSKPNSNVHAGVLTPIT